MSAVRDNDQIVLDRILAQSRQSRSTIYPESDFFELFCFEQLLKDYGLTDDNLEYGWCGGGGDGGIDGFFIFSDNNLLTEDQIPTLSKRGTVLEVFIIQSKTSASFEEVPIQKLLSSCTDIFDFDKQYSQLETMYNSDLMKNIRIFRDSYLQLASLHPKVNIRFFYCSSGKTSEIHPNINAKKIQLLNEVRSKVRAAESIELTFLGAKELNDLHNKVKATTLELECELISSCEPTTFIALTPLANYYKFISSEGGLRGDLLESNVRAYAGDVDVNTDIKNTLESNDANINFWWLNNGVTIIASRAQPITTKKLVIDNCQIVNGLQTTQTVYDYFKAKSGIEDKDNHRLILIRVIVADEAEIIDSIIKATNFQNPIPRYALKGRAAFQRRIEDYFKSYGLFYDRRRNYYKNQGKPSSQIITIPYLSQAIMSILLKQPDFARARPSTLINKPDDYERIFDESVLLTTYFFCAKTMKTIDLSLATLLIDERRRLKNFRFHTALCIILKLLHSRTYANSDVDSLQNSIIDRDLIVNTAREVHVIAEEHSRQENVPMDVIAKNKRFVSILIQRITL